MSSTIVAKPYDFRSLMPAPLPDRHPDWPLLEAAKQRNVVLDQMFYDVGALSPAECDWLVRERTVGGAILVVSPKGADGDISIRKHADHAALRAAPGDRLTRFSVSGIGSSDLGAAALARNLADHYREPVGAVVAGYGVADLVTEGFGGWFALGAVNQWRSLIDGWWAWWMAPPADTSAPASIATASLGDAAGGPEADTLLALMREEDRPIRSLFGHSKGGVAIALALQRLAETGPSPALDAAKAIAVTTLGAVVQLPAGFDKVTQFLGALDWYGGLNSYLDRDYRPVPGAWHHLNSALPLHVGIDALLAQAETAGGGRVRQRRAAR